MNENKRQKLFDLFDALLKAGLNPESFAKNELFVIATKQYITGKRDIDYVVDVANKINIIAGGKFSESGAFTA